MTDRRIARRRVTPLPAAGRAIASAALAAALAAGASACTASDQSPTHRSPASSQGASASTQPPLGYRSLPAFLPRTPAPVDRVVTASASRPQLAVQGVGVQVTLPSAGVLATVTGPHVPPFVTPPPPQVTATFDVSLARATGAVPVRLADFTITDQLGRHFHPTLTAQEKRPAGTIAAGHTVTFQLTAAMPTGEGRLYWAPTGGAPVVGWDFIVEND